VLDEPKGLAGAEDAAQRSLIEELHDAKGNLREVALSTPAKQTTPQNVRDLRTQKKLLRRVATPSPSPGPAPSPQTAFAAGTLNATALGNALRAAAN